MRYYLLAIAFQQSGCANGGVNVYACVVQFYGASFDDLLVENEENTIHVRNMQMFMIEVYKSLNHQNPSFLWELLARREINCSLRIKDILTLPKALTTSFGTNSMSFRGSIIWNSTPDVIKSSNAVFAFIKNIKNWAGEVCNCNVSA